MWKAETARILDIVVTDNRNIKANERGVQNTTRIAIPYDGTSDSYEKIYNRLKEIKFPARIYVEIQRLGEIRVHITSPFDLDSTLEAAGYKPVKYIEINDFLDNDIIPKYYMRNTDYIPPIHGMIWKAIKADNNGQWFIHQNEIDRRYMEMSMTHTNIPTPPKSELSW